ncbi:MAG TPA: D-alanyl-D-alanine carboxypeptidase [Streptosporangiaceae bacterium]|nr:D-alanyl-D-alanine carboxypeptidase [Streptosporangiaceae bacterium]
MRIPVRVLAIAAAGGIVAGGVTAWAIATPAPAPASPAGGDRPAATRPAATRPASPAASPGQAGAATGSAAQAVKVIGAPGDVKARGGVLADAATGDMLWSRDLDTERPIGSITKVMTALVVIRAGDLGREIRVPAAVIPYVDKYGADSAGLHPGDVLTAQQLLEAMLLPSGCDAAYTLAVTYGPGMPAFLAKMNATARQLGMMHTQFTSPDGLPYPTEYSTFSTPSDLLRLGLAAMKLPAFRSIVGQSFYQIRKGPGHHAYWWNNTNDLIGTYPGADGIKTGFTNAALHCLLFEATRGGLTLIGDVLGSPATGPASGADAATKVLNWGFGLPRA